MKKQQKLQKSTICRILDELQNLQILKQKILQQFKPWFLCYTDHNLFVSTINICSNKNFSCMHWGFQNLKKWQLSTARNIIRTKKILPAAHFILLTVCWTAEEICVRVGSFGIFADSAFKMYEKCIYMVYRACTPTTYTQNSPTG